jgi:alpha-2-macroglobulin
MKNLKIAFKALTVAFTAISLLISCNKTAKKTPMQIDPAFTGYISAFTSGVISNQSVITIKLVDVPEGAVAGQDIDKNLFDFSPKITGKTYWADERTIEFKPDELISSGKIFEAHFHLDKILHVPKKVETLTFQFQTIKQSIKVFYTGNEPYDPHNLEWQKLKGKLYLNDFAPDEIIPELITAVQKGKKLNITWEHGADGKEHIFTVDSVSRTEIKSKVILEWDGKPLNIKDQGDLDIDIPPLGDFKVVNTIITQAPEQHITIYFSDPLDPNQELEGLIHLDNNIPVRLQVKDNIINVFPRNRITAETKLIVEDGVRNIMNYQMSERYEQTIKFSNIKPAVELIGQGVILPSSDGLIFPFKAVNIRAVNVKIIKIFENNIGQFLQVNQFDGTRELKRVGRIVYKDEIVLTSEKAIDYGQWNTFALDLSKLIQTESGAIYRVQINFNKNQSLYPCESSSDDNATKNTDYREEESYFDGPNDNYYYYDDYDYGYDDNYSYSERDNPCSPSYFHRYARRAVARNILASDLGIIAKGGNSKNLFVAVTDIRTTEPLSNVEISIYNYQNQLISRTLTDAQGMASIDLDKKPFLLIARKDQQKGYLRLDDGSSLSLSMFDISGQKNTKGIKGYIYGERGVWRPGDSLFVTFMLEDKNNIIPSDHPVTFELYTPENQLYIKRTKTNPVNGFYDFRTATKSDAPTGNWQAVVHVGGSKFMETIKIETVKPNRLKINLDFGTDIIRKGDNLQGILEVKWLHGAIARNLNADVNVTLAQGHTKFDKYPDYIFDDPAKKFNSEEQTIFDGAVNEQGKATIAPKFNISTNAPGMINARFKVRAFEESGDFSVDQFTLPYSPYKGYVGLKIPKGKGWNGAIFSNEPNIIPIVTVNDKGTPVNRNNVRIEVYEVSWRWWWERSEEDDLARYIANNVSKRVIEDYINTKDGKAMYELNFGKNTWGRKYIKVTDPVSGHSSGALFYTTYKGWWSNAGQDNPGGAEMLTFSTDKNKYNVGEQIKVELPASETGRALVSLESGSSIVDAFWIETSKENHSFNFEATSDMAPNIYIHISYIQPHKQVENDLPIRLYGVQSIRVEDAMTHLSPVITMPDVLAPEENVTIQVGESKGRKMTYTLALVDEGLLDLTRFTTPDAWHRFYAREALGIKTWDMYKYVLGSFSGEMAGLYAVGGDEELADKGGQKANRFKPVVKFIGPVELGASKTNTHTFKMPNYVGSVRIMVVGGQDGAYGSAEKTTPVKKPLMVLATLPRVVGPTEKVKLPVTVFAMDKSIKNVSVEIGTNKFFKIDGDAKKSVKFSQEGDKIVYFDLDVQEIIGTGKVHVTAKSGNEKATYDFEIDVRLPNPRVTNIINTVVQAGKSWSGPFEAIGVQGTNNGVVEISAIPPLNLEERLKYLLQYPHGCIEQTTSSVFPQLHLSSLLDLSDQQKTEIENNIKAGIERLRTFQISNGGLSYWPGEINDASDWGTNYAGHFMLEAQALGYNLPTGFIDNWVRYQKQRANDWEPGSKGTHRHYYNSTQLIQAYRLYTLALAGKPAIGAMNRMKEINDLSVAATWRLAAAYYLAGRKKVATDMITQMSVQVAPYRELSYSYGSTERDQAMILETLVLMGEITKAKPLIEELSGDLASNHWYSTQTTAYTLLAIAKFVGGTGNSNNLNFNYSLNNGKDTRIKSDVPIYQLPLDFSKNKSGNIKISNNSDKTIFVKIMLDGIPLIGDNTSADNNLTMSLSFMNLQGQKIDPAHLVQGTDFIAEVRIHHPGIRADYKEMALTHIFPSGWEIRNLRMEEGSSLQMVDVPRYQDIRDDRVYSYFNIDKNETKIYRVLLNAAYLGKFYMPTVYCEAMYDNEINAKIPGRWVYITDGNKTAGDEE